MALKRPSFSWTPTLMNGPTNFQIRTLMPWRRACQPQLGDALLRHASAELFGLVHVATAFYLLFLQKCEFRMSGESDSWEANLIERRYS
ncbi:MAG: hypothetical protein M3N82_06130 [Pseudomonadota bacterium]|nr:hypothetical protein [Pseudomonadota bacterium]